MEEFHCCIGWSGVCREGIQSYFSCPTFPWRRGSLKRNYDTLEQVRVQRPVRNMAEVKHGESIEDRLEWSIIMKVTGILRRTMVSGSAHA